MALKCLHAIPFSDIHLVWPFVDVTSSDFCASANGGSVSARYMIKYGKNWIVGDAPNTHPIHYVLCTNITFFGNSYKVEMYLLREILIVKNGGIETAIVIDW